MLILIAESKTMSPCDSTVQPTEYRQHIPELESRADIIMKSLHGISLMELAHETKLSPAMAGRLQKMIYEFPNKAIGAKAIEAFTGVVFRAFEYKSLNEEDKKKACARIRIISSLYGWLRPDDIIKQYRFDFTTPLAPDGKRLAAYWQNPVTTCLLKSINENGIKNILNLMPGDAERAIDLKSVERRAKIWKISFQEVIPGGTTRTPNSNKLKSLRGKLLRHIIQDGIDLPEQLMSLSGRDYFCENISEESGIITFTTVSDRINRV